MNLDSVERSQDVIVLSLTYLSQVRVSAVLVHRHYLDLQ
jgi:hypothetical protein